ncbi:MAG: PspC domain-containing protein [Eubacterium sp.]
MEKKLYKSLTDRKICGVCGGIANYFAIDATIIRLIWAIAVLCCGCGILAYIICAIVIPDEPVDIQYNTYCNPGEQYYDEENKG